jgi:hypothetical protein
MAGVGSVWKSFSRDLSTMPTTITAALRILDYFCVYFGCLGNKNVSGAKRPKC